MSLYAAQTAKILLVGSVGALGLLSGINNILDYRTNFEVVRHVLYMDALPPGSASLGAPLPIRACGGSPVRSSSRPNGSTDVFASSEPCASLRAAPRSFDSAKGLAVAGLTLGFALYFFGFLVIGGEWFQTWQAGQ